MRVAGLGALAVVMTVATGCESVSTITGPDASAASAGDAEQPRDSRYTLAYPDWSSSAPGTPRFSRYTLAYPAD